MYHKNNSFYCAIVSLNYHHKSVIPNMIFQSFVSKFTFVTNLVTISLLQVARGNHICDCILRLIQTWKDLKYLSNTCNPLVQFLDFTWHCSTAVAGLVTLDFISNTAFYAVEWVFSPQHHFPHSSIFLTAEGNRTCKFDQILWPMLSSTKIEVILAQLLC